MGRRGAALIATLSLLGYGLVLWGLTAGTVGGNKGLEVRRSLVSEQREAKTLLDTLAAYAGCYGSITLLLPQWQLRVGYADTMVEWTAETSVNTKYRWAVILFDSAAIVARTDHEIRQVVVHELAHVWSAELSELAVQADADDGDRAREQLASLVERWPFWPLLCPWEATNEGGGR